METIVTTGKRKTAIAKVRMKTSGSGKITVNKLPIEEYFPLSIQRTEILRPLVLTEMQDSVDINVSAIGGGKSGQAGAMRLGIARALVEINEENKSALREESLLTRDPRMVERKKYGRKKARKRFQFSKR